MSGCPVVIISPEIQTGWQQPFRNICEPVARFRLKILLVCSLVTGVLGSRAQDTRDAAFVRRYEKGNVIEWNTGDYSSTFNFQGFAKHPSNFMLAANSNWYTGFFLKL